jgi:hypothetical protein
VRTEQNATTTKALFSPEVFCKETKNPNFKQPTKILTLIFFDFGVYFPKSFAKFFRFSVT